MSFSELNSSRLFKNKYTARLAGIIRYWPELPVAVVSFIRFALLRVSKRTVLLVEPNTFHGEIQPGCCKYFEDLGYDVVVVCRYANQSENVFCRFQKAPMVFTF